MFQAIDALVTPDNPLKITVSRGADGTLKVCVMPSAGKNPVLNQPIALCATAAELDEGFAGAVAAYNASRSGLAEQVAATAAILAQAKQNEAGKASKAIKGKAAAAPAAAGEEDHDDEEEEGQPGGNNAPVVTPAKSAAPAAPANDLLALFGDE